MSFAALVLACILGVFGLYLAKLEARTEPTSGQVVEVTVLPDGGTVPTIAFATPDGRRFSFTGLERDSTPWRVGEAVGVRYDPGQPRYAHADDALSRWWLPVALIVAAILLACPDRLLRRRLAPSSPMFRRQPGERIELSTAVAAQQGGSTRLRQLYVTDRRIVLGQIRVPRLLAHLLLAVILAIQLLTLIPAVPPAWYFPIGIAAILVEAYRFSRTAPIVAEHPPASITSLSLTEPAPWVRQGLVVSFSEGDAWTLHPAGRGGTTARPYAEKIAAVSGRPVSC